MQSSNAGACASGVVTPLVDPVSTRSFLADFGAGISSGYVGYRIHGITDPWIKVTLPAGQSLQLAANQSSNIKAAGSSQNVSGDFLAYAYLTAASSTNLKQTVYVEVFSGNPATTGVSQCTTSQDFNYGVGKDELSSGDVIGANPNKVTSIATTFTSTKIVGNTFTVTVKGDTGTWNSSLATRSIVFSPSTNANWPESSYQLTGINFSIDGASWSIKDSVGAAVNNVTYPDTGKFTAVYTYLINSKANTSAVISPINYIDSGGNLKHTGSSVADLTLAANSYTFTGPSSGVINTASSVFTLTPNGVVGSNTTITITLSGNKGSLTNPSVVFSAGSSASKTFTITPTVAGTITLTPSAFPVLGTNPAALNYVVSSSGYTVTISTVTGGSGTASPSTVSSGGSSTLQATPSAGYTFTSWSCTGGTLSSTTANPATLSNITSSVTCTPTFSAATYSVTYNGNSNDTGTVPIDPVAYNSGNSVTVRANTGGLESTGFTFDGWCTSKPSAGNTCESVSGTKYAGSGSATFSITRNVTLYAVWLATNLTVTYDGNTNTAGSAPVDTNTYASGATATVLDKTPSLAKNLYDFAGWCLTQPTPGSDCSGTKYSFNDSVTVNGFITLYAIWSPAAGTYSVTYDGNLDDSGTEPTDDNSPYSSGSTVTVLGNTGSLTNGSYVFSGWCTTQPTVGSACTGTKYSASATFTITNSVTLYAIWLSNTPPAPVYVPHPPTITSISAPEVCAVSSQLVIKGTWLSGATAKVDAQAARVISSSSNEMTIELPSAPVGTKTITVTNVDGSATTTVKYSFADTPIYVNYVYPETYKDREFSYTFRALDAAKYEISGIMPAGLTLNPLTGELSGAPTQTGDFVFQIIASNICASTPLVVYMFVDKAIPDAFTCSVAFNVPASNNITEQKLANLRNCLSKTSTLSPKYIDPVIFISGGIPAGLTSDQALTHPRYLPILDLIKSMNLNAQIYYGAFNGSTDSVQLNVYWPDPA